MRLKPFLEDKYDTRKVYDNKILRPKKTSLVKKVFNKTKTWVQSRVKM